MNFLPTSIPEELIVEPRVFEDERGFFLESYQARQFAAAGIATNFVQDNQSGSRRGVIGSGAGSGSGDIAGKQVELMEHRPGNYFL